MVNLTRGIIILSVFATWLPLSCLAGTVHLPATGQTTNYAAGDDGDLRKGAPWPSPRFRDNGDGTVTDKLTGLKWAKNGNLAGDTKTWQEALDYIAAMNAGTYPNFGYTDWRLPNVNELESLGNAEESAMDTWLEAQAFTDVQASLYWSATSFANATSQAWIVFIPDNDISHDYKYQRIGFVWPVRAGQEDTRDPAYPANLWKTGEDKDTEFGVKWPSPRFRDNGDGTVTDNLTRLRWAKDGNLAGGVKTWQEALDYVAGMNAGTYPNFGCTDWRLPNRKELYSLIDFSQALKALPSNHPFVNVNSYYWSSTTFAISTPKAWYIDVRFGNTDFVYKTQEWCYVWPVRGNGATFVNTPCFMLMLGD